MNRVENFAGWYEGQFDLTKDETEALRNTAGALLQNSMVLRVLAQMEANAIKHLIEADPSDREDLANRAIMVHAVQALPRIMEILVSDKAFDKSLNRE